jgi:hypothetical protein
MPASRGGTAPEPGAQESEKMTGRRVHSSAICAGNPSGCRLRSCAPAFPAPARKAFSGFFGGFFYFIGFWGFYAFGRLRVTA